MIQHPKFITALALLISLCSIAQAGTLTDSAALFGNRTEEVRATLAGIPVSVETRQTLPPEDLRTYADNRVSKEFDRGFFVVIVTTPRGWRISMNPQTLASSERVRVLGDEMAASFKQGQYVEGVKRLATSLNQLTLPQPPSTANAATAAPTASANAQAAGLQSPAKPASARKFPIGAILLGAITVFILLALISKKRTQTPDTSKPPANAEEAGKIFNAYTPEQRQQLASQHATYAKGDTLHDPMAFAMMLFMANQLNAAGDESARQANNNTPPSSHSSSSSSTSDSSGASGSW